MEGLVDGLVLVEGALLMDGVWDGLALSQVCFPLPTPLLPPLPAFPFLCLKLSMQVGTIDSDGTREGTCEVEGLLETEGSTLGTVEGASEGAPEREGTVLGADEIEGCCEVEGTKLARIVGRIVVFADGMEDGILVPLFVFPPLPLLLPVRSRLRSKPLLVALTVPPL